ncbi:hypothetical protein [Niveispirillum fermenti]|uniref:hypothetical protein n=1 Tax=Niveispirillum fermenti TaxID=1233113 RepID=UPI0040411A10
MAFLLLGGLLAGCAAQLAPAYSPALVQGLQTLNQQAMQLFAQTAGGVPQATFQKREETYTALIGQATALANLARARPDPAGLPKFVELKLKDWTKVQTFAAPTGDILTKIANDFSMMRQSDQQAGLSLEEARLFQNGFSIDVQQALMYENALNRDQ